MKTLSILLFLWFPINLCAQNPTYLSTNDSLKLAHYVTSLNYDTIIFVNQTSYWSDRMPIVVGIRNGRFWLIKNSKIGVLRLKSRLRGVNEDSLQNIVSELGRLKSMEADSLNNFVNPNSDLYLEISDGPLYSIGYFTRQVNDFVIKHSYMPEEFQSTNKTVDRAYFLMVIKLFEGLK